MPDLSIAIVTYNDEKYIEKCIGSIIGHIGGGLSYRLYVIDNNSRDRTVDLAKGFTTGKAANETSDKITLIQNSKTSASALPQPGAGHAGFPLPPGCQPDITIVNDCITEMAAYMDKHPGIGLLSPLIKYRTEEPNTCAKGTPRSGTCSSGWHSRVPSQSGAITLR